MYLLTHARQSALSRGGIAALLALVAIPLGAAVQYAPMMPLAHRSLLLDVAAADNRVVAVGERGHILFSDDRGSTWQQARVPTIQMLTAVHFIDARRGWAVGHDGIILASDDGGETWRVQRDGLAAQRQANIENRERAHRAVLSLEQALAAAGDDERDELEVQLDDARMDLEDADIAQEEEVFTSPLMDIWFQDGERGWAVGAFGTVLGTSNGGQTWASLAGELDNPDEFHLNAITGDGRGRVFIAGEGGTMFRSLDGGGTWESLEPFYEGSWFGVLYSPRHDALFVCGLRGNLYRSSDFGDSWEAARSPGEMTLAGGSVSTSGRIAFVGAVGTLLQSTDGGITFERTMLPDRLSLTSALYTDHRLIVAGQGGARTREDADTHE